MVASTSLVDLERSDLVYLWDVYEEIFDGGYKFVDISESLDSLIDGLDRKSTRLNSSHLRASRMPSSA